MGMSVPASTTPETAEKAELSPDGGTSAPLLERLRTRGWRVTPQRRAVVGALAGEHVHRTAEQIHAEARELVPEVSIATVYNTLNELVAMGEISELHVGDGSARYDPKVGPDHHHLICASCGAIYDVDPVGIEGMGLRADERHGMRIDAVEVTFRGVCQDCLE